MSSTKTHACDASLCKDVMDANAPLYYFRFPLSSSKFEREKYFCCLEHMLNFMVECLGDWELWDRGRKDDLMEKVTKRKIKQDSNNGKD